MLELLDREKRRMAAAAAAEARAAEPKAGNLRSPFAEEMADAEREVCVEAEGATRCMMPCLTSTPG